MVKGKLSFVLSVVGSLLEDGWEVIVLLRMRSKLCREKGQLWGRTTQPHKAHSGGRAAGLCLGGCGWSEWLLGVNVGRGWVIFQMQRSGGYRPGVQ